MIKRITGFFIVLVLLAFSVTASAQIRPGTFNIGPLFGVGTFEGNQNLDNAPVIGIRGGYDFTERWGVEATINWIPTRYNYRSITGYTTYTFGNQQITVPVYGDKDDTHVNVYNYRVEGIYNFMPDKRLVPFVAVGLGGQTIDYRGSNAAIPKDKTRFTADYGVGLKYFLTESLAIRGDVRHVLAIGSIYNNLEATLGMAFYFGGKKEAPAPPPPVAAAEKKILEEGRITLNIEFDFDKTVVRPQYREEIRDVADFMTKYPKTRFSIEGHTCSIGTAEYNQRLSQRRADSVKQYIINNFDIEGNRLESIGYGESKPIADNSTEAGRERNRRVEAVLIE